MYPSVFVLLFLAGLLVPRLGLDVSWADAEGRMSLHAWDYPRLSPCVALMQLFGVGFLVLRGCAYSVHAYYGPLACEMTFLILFAIHGDFFCASWIGVTARGGFIW